MKIKLVIDSMLESDAELLIGSFCFGNVKSTTRYYKRGTQQVPRTTFICNSRDAKNLIVECDHGDIVSFSRIK